MGERRIEVPPSVSSLLKTHKQVYPIDVQSYINGWCDVLYFYG